MANKIRWDTPNSYDAALSTGLNSLASGSSAISSNIANGTDLLILMDVSIILASFTPGTAPPGYFEIHVSPLLDDATHYADVYTAGPTQVGVVGLLAGASVKYGMLSGIQIPPGDFKLAILSQAGATLASSGNTVKSRRYDLNANA